MKQFWIQIAVLMIIIFGAFFLTFNANPLFTTFLNNSPSGSTSSSVVRINANTINVEVADTPDKRIRGLSGRESLASSSGMLFVFPKPDKYQFWMKDMKFPLDFIWIKDDHVVDLLKNIPIPAPNQTPETLPVYEPVTLIDKVLEVSAGYIDTHNINVGDKVDFIHN